MSDEQVEELDEEFISYSADADTTCAICQAEFLDPDDLTIHLHQIHKISDETYGKKCQFCTSTYTDLLDYAEHLRDNHIVHIKCCQYCLRAFHNTSELISHENRHGKRTNRSLYKCTQCDRKFGNNVELKTHDFECHNNNEDGIMIQEYLPYLSAVLNVKAATLLQSFNTDTVYICVGCDYSTADIYSYLIHASLNICTTYVCGKCSNVYKKKHNLKRHMSKECDKSLGIGKWVVCPECQLIFSKYAFPKHKRNCRAIKCYTCNVRFNTMYELSEHQSKEHPLSVELKTCKFCWKQCVGNVALQKHIDRSHKSDLHLYKYLCIYCKSAYKHPQKLFGHFFSKHKDISPYTCKICDKTFRLRKKFTLHIKLDHKSVGFVEFDENYHVFFVEKKSENPFVPKTIYAETIRKQNENAALAELEDSSDIGLLNVNSEMSVTETEGNQTEIESVSKRTLKRKRIPKACKDAEPIPVESSDDEPLLVVKKRVQKTMPKIIRNRRTKKQLTNINKKRFTCNVCKKYCYTYQNYNHHISLHSNKDNKKCIKCSQVFRSKEKLSKHIANEHSSSKLTETLKTLLENRKNGRSMNDDLPMSERFRRTIKKVKSDCIQSSATITPVESGLSVQKFIENFTPEGENKSEIVIDHDVTFKIVTGIHKEPTIRMTKFELKPTPSSTRLSMPVKFKECYQEKSVASIRLVQPSPVYEVDSSNNDFHHYDDNNDMDETESIPDVAEEVMLEETDETPKVVPIPHKIVIPKLPLEYKDIRIAHLLPQAPFYKIVKVNEVLKMQSLDSKPKEAVDNCDTIKLPNGTKLVNSNPLAHLLSKTSIEKALQPIKNKYYKPRRKNFQGMLAQALTNLDKPAAKRKKKEPEVAEAIE